MSEKEEGVEVSSDEDFQTVLDISAELFEQGYFEVRPGSWGIDIAVEDELLREVLRDRDMALQEYQRILDRELDVLLTALILGMSDETLLGAPPLEGASDDQKEEMLERRSTVRQRFPIERLQAELRATRKNVGALLAGMSWQIVRGEAAPKGRRIAPAAILRFGGAPPEVIRTTPGYMEKPSGATLLLGLGDPSVAFFGCTLSDVNYLIRRLEKVREELEREEAESHD